MRAATNPNFHAVDRALERLYPWAAERLSELVKIKSVTGEEAEVQARVAALFKDLNLEVDVWSPERVELVAHPAFSDDGLPLGTRPVVVGRLAGDERRPGLVLNAHVDVVPEGDRAGWAHDPWGGEVIDGWVHGRGSCDMKGGLIAGITAVAGIQEAGASARHDVLIQSVIGEETGGVGTLAAILRGHVGSAAIVLEPTRLAICPIGAGAASFRLRMVGRAAHAARRREGVNVIEKFHLIFDALMGVEQDRHRRFRNPAYGPEELVAPINVGRLVAGEWPSSVPESLAAEGRLGVFPGESLGAARHALEEAVGKAIESDPWLRDHPPKVEWIEGQFESCSTPLESPLVEQLSWCHSQVHETPAQIEGVTYGSDLRFFTNNAGMPGVLYGPGDVNLAHTNRERIEVSEIITAAKALARLIVVWEAGN